jgi:hypothetical protein
LHETTEEESVAPKACTFSVVEAQEPATRGRGGSTSQDNRQTAKGGRKSQRVKKEVHVNAPALLEHSLKVEDAHKDEAKCRWKQQKRTFPNRL